MSPLLQTLTDRAFHSAPLGDANQAIDHVRAEVGSEFGSALSYELAVPALDPDAWLTHKALPKLVYFLDCRGVKLPQTPGIFVSLFTPERLLFLDAGEVVDVLREARGLSLEEVVRRYGDGGAGEPALLGG